MIVIGLTGSIGMGKTTTANMLRDMGVFVHDSDACVHKLLGPGGAGVAPVQAAFPASFDPKTGAIDRRRLRDLVGHDHEKWNELERILHPLVQQSQQEFLREMRSKGAQMVALDIPLLFETGAEQRVDYTICVTCPAFLQRQRVMARPGATEEDFAFRLSRQMPDAEKRRRADFVVSTGIGLAETRAELETVIRTIKQNRKPSHDNGRLPPQ